MPTTPPDPPRPGQLPPIANYWPDLPQRLGPPADYFDSGEVPAGPTPARAPDGRPLSAQTTAPPTPARTPDGRPLSAQTAARTTPDGRLLYAETAAGLVPGRSAAPAPDGRFRYAETAAPLVPAPLAAPAGLGAAAAKPRRGRILARLAVAGLLVAGGLAAGVALQRRGDDRSPAAPAPTAAFRPAPGAVSPEPATASTPAGDLQAADFVLASDAGEVKLRTGVLDGDLYRITAPGGSGVRPSVTIKDGTVSLTLVETGRRGPSVVDIVLSDAVTWGLRIDGGLSTGELDLSGVRVKQVRLAGDAADLRLVMPEPDGTVAVRVTGGINRLRVSVPDRTPMRIRARGGGGEVALDGKSVRGVARDTAFETDDWRDRRDRLEVDATSGFGTLRAEHRKP